MRKFEKLLIKHNVKYEKLEEKDGCRYLVSSKHDILISTLAINITHEWENRDDYNNILIKIFD